MASTDETPKTPRRSWSISLRTMLLLVLAVGVPMGWWARRAHFQRRAVAMVEAGNGSVVYDHEVLKRSTNAGPDILTPEGERRQLKERFKNMGLGPPAKAASSSPGQASAPQPPINRAIKALGVDFAVDVVQVTAIGNKPGEQFDPARLADLPNLERLNIQLKPIGDEDLVHLTGLKRLRFLCLAHTKITDEALNHIAKLEGLEDLILTHNEGRITDAGLARLKPLKRLRILEVGGPNITDASLARFRKMPGLRYIFLQDALNVTHGGVAELGRDMPQLKVKHTY